MQIKQVLLDMDGVLTDFVKAICREHNRPNPYENAENYGKFDMDKIWGMKAREFWGPCDYSFWRTLDWMDDGRKTLAFLDEIIGEENICILTAPSSNERCYDGKRDWINDHIRGRKMMAGSAKEFCSAPTRLLIDDRDSNVKKYIESGGIAFLVPRPWNSAWERQDGWLLQLERLFLGASL